MQGQAWLKMLASLPIAQHADAKASLESTWRIYELHRNHVAIEAATAAAAAAADPAPKIPTNAAGDEMEADITQHLMDSIEEGWSVAGVPKGAGGSDASGDRKRLRAAVEKAAAKVVKTTLKAKTDKNKAN